MDRPAKETAGTEIVAGHDLRDRSLAEVLARFAAGKPVPGSGSANAVAAALAASLVASVARKTSEKDTYIQVRQTSIDVARNADAAVEKLLDLCARDSAQFADVVAIRIDTGRVADPIRQDDSLRKEIAASKGATETPLEIARIALDVGRLAAKMLDVGFTAASGESYTALAQSLAAAHGAIAVAQLNIRTVRKKIARLNDPQLEAHWIKRMLLHVGELRNACAELGQLESGARGRSHEETANALVIRKRSKKANRKPR